MENVRESNLAFSQLKVGEYLTYFFSLIGMGSAIVGSEINYYYNEHNE
jgi:hypothetical protein